MTREEAVGVIERLPVMSYMKKNEKQTIITTALDMAIEALQEQERKWIPVSERLPEKDGYYFVTKRLIDGRIQTDIEPFWTGADWWKSEFHFAGIDLWEVLAWQPLPEPYKAGDE